MYAYENLEFFRGRGGGQLAQHIVNRYSILGGVEIWEYSEGSKHILINQNN